MKRKMQANGKEKKIPIKNTRNRGDVINNKLGNKIAKLRMMNINKSFAFACSRGIMGNDSNIVCPVDSRFSKLKTKMLLIMGDTNK
jgi:hypothetical protein